ncbi:unnamed protein product [Cuscuta europaea]|uniref:Uncharacterized protein n=1 Tax=Cuscuta europaea TaxID=41803 RepID=A0A9P0YSW8_CUSEU|nr:unnamed protein product [Cuscuta europaea]
MDLLAGLRLPCDTEILDEMDTPFVAKELTSSAFKAAVLGYEMALRVEDVELKARVAVQKRADLLKGRHLAEQALKVAQEQIYELKKRAQDAEARFHECQAQFGALKETADASFRALSDTEIYARSAEDRARDADERATTAIEKAKIATTEWQRMIDVSSLAMKERDRLKKVLAVNEAELCSSRSRCLMLEDQLVVVTRERREWEADHDRVALELEDARSQTIKQGRILERLRKQAEDAKARVAGLEIDLASRDADLGKLREELSEVRLDSGHVKARIMSLEAEMAATQKKLENYMVGHSTAVERAKGGAVSEFQASCSTDPASPSAVNWLHGVMGKHINSWLATPAGLEFVREQFLPTL